MARRLFALIFGILGASSVLLMAYARHAGNDAAHLMKQEYLTIAANMLLPHAFLGIFAISQYDRIGKFAYFTASLIMGGVIFFCGGLILTAFGITSHAPSAPLGGICFAASWLVIGTAFFAKLADKNP